MNTEVSNKPVRDICIITQKYLRIIINIQTNLNKWTKTLHYFMNNNFNPFTKNMIMFAKLKIMN